MSDPRTDYRDAPQGVITELISAMSALNMEPEPLPADQIKHDTGYLSDTDKWVRHAMEHLYAAYGMAQSCGRVFYAVDVLMRMSGIHPKATIGDDGSESIPTSFSVDEMVEFSTKQYQEARTRLTFQSHAHEVVEMARQRKEIGLSDDGYQYYWPTGKGGAIAAEELRALADELDRLNEGWDREVKAMEAMEASGK